MYAHSCVKNTGKRERTFSTTISSQGNDSLKVDWENWDASISMQYSLFYLHRNNQWVMKLGIWNTASEVHHSAIWYFIIMFHVFHIYNRICFASLCSILSLRSNPSIPSEQVEVSWQHATSTRATPCFLRCARAHYELHALALFLPVPLM